MISRSYETHPRWKLITLSVMGRLLGIQFKVNGFPYGAEYRYHVRDDDLSHSAQL